MSQFTVYNEANNAYELRNPDMPIEEIIELLGRCEASETYRESLSFGQMLKETRLNKKLTQSKLAYTIGISQSLYAQFESEKRKPSTNYVYKFSRILDIPYTILSLAYKNTFINYVEIEGLGELIKAERRSAGLSVKKLAKKIGVSEASINRFEKNIEEPHFTVLSKIAESCLSSMLRKEATRLCEDFMNCLKER